MASGSGCERRPKASRTVNTLLSPRIYTICSAETIPTYLCDDQKLRDSRTPGKAQGCAPRREGQLPRRTAPRLRSITICPGSNSAAWLCRAGSPLPLCTPKPLGWMVRAFFWCQDSQDSKIHEPEAHSREDRNIPFKDLSWRENLAGMSRSLGSCPHPATDSSDRESSILIDEEMVWKRDGGRALVLHAFFFFLLQSSTL